ncbi:relaxase/mobilization nuclease domain-containing protein [Corynebacterium sp. ES2715-CONJ3]|nr:relaxase/mobilization nuclease domain-containing protein [Corynebacterium sp. ES2715-CONJ3]
MVATHTDKAHVHYHIIIANHDRDSGRAAPKEAGNAWRVRVANDEVMESFGLEVLRQHPVSYSREERLAQSQGRESTGSGLALDELTRENWREFARAQTEDLMLDPRVVAAVDVDGGNGVEPALDVMEEIAPKYNLSFSRKGRGKRKRERSSFALVSDVGKEIRVPGRDGKGASRAATAGSRLGADYTLDGFRVQLHLLHAEKLLEEMGHEDSGYEYTTDETRRGRKGWTTQCR